MKFLIVGNKLLEMSNIPPGLQLYSVREETEADFFGTLEKVAGMGYKTVEFAGYGGIPAAEMKRELDRLGLLGISTHVPIDKLKVELNQQIEYALTLGAQYIVCPVVPRDTLLNIAKFNELVSFFQKVGKEIKRNGLQFAYHNHINEFEVIQGTFVLDRLLKEVGTDLMKLELDVYWVKKAGLNPAAVLEYYKGLVPLIHVKDMDPTGNFTEVGRGILDWPSILSVTKRIGVKYYFVEQDDSEHPLISAKMSIEYLKSIGAT
ncbi:sugar phosphate isomerase/epimerase [Paenibacillus sp. LHD-38]|uniref:sugar phosphate isomerase/epimerase family protein n=1 Tax=Paenibacillus sp. LHD-38 TaxID=3072143 RepID=UPI00280CA718|nr:sugar phosphate isomerase/epimerase [Paenibacillus sp. LHD-38]MDQ8737116.1 sugar phosphate isomerase/epimerase [Paenibacillus sp. LHD-38]